MAVPDTGLVSLYPAAPSYGQQLHFNYIQASGAGA